MKTSNVIFTVKCSDWSINVEASSFSEACSKGLELMISRIGANLNLSFIICAENKIDNEMEIFETSSVLADLGFFKLSKNLSELSDFLLDKGENPH